MSSVVTRKRQSVQAGFVWIVVLAILVIIAIASITLLVVRHKDSTKSAQTDNKQTQSVIPSKSPPAQSKPADPHTGWKTYVDTGYSESSGISIRYPSDWQVKVGGSNAFGWQIINNSNPNLGIGVRDTFLAGTTTPKEEWDNCSSADACGPSPGSVNLSASSSTINGLASYNVKMQSASGGIYYATIIKSNTPATDGTVAFVEFKIDAPDQATLNTYSQIIASVTDN